MFIFRKLRMASKQEYCDFIGQTKQIAEISQILDMGLAFPERKSLARTVLLYGVAGEMNHSFYKY